MSRIDEIQRRLYVGYYTTHTYHDADIDITYLLSEISRLEGELKEAKEIILVGGSFVDLSSKAIDAYNKLQAENAELKRANENYANIIQVGCGDELCTCPYLAENAALRERLERVQNESIKLVKRIFE